jgi:hypothetical protein
MAGFLVSTVIDSLITKLVVARLRQPLCNAVLLLYFSLFSLNAVLQFDQAHRLINGKSPVQERVDQEVFVLMHWYTPYCTCLGAAGRNDVIRLVHSAHTWQLQPAGGSYSAVGGAAGLEDI